MSPIRLIQPSLHYVNLQNPVLLQRNLSTQFASCNKARETCH